MLTFESENLVVDWISFNITGCTDPEPIANYFSESFGFNSFLKETYKGKSEVLISEITNRYQVYFIKSTYNPEYNSYWNGITVSFSGQNAAYFYQKVKDGLVDWNVFDLEKTNLGRVDLKYFREKKSNDIYTSIDTDEKNVKLFMIKSYEKIVTKDKRKYAKWERNNKGLILRIGQRASDNYFRVYQNETSLKKGLSFELEIKNQTLLSFQEHFFSDQIEEFEKELAKYFYKQSLKAFRLDSCYTDWLSIGSRRVEKKYKNEVFVTSYFGDIDLSHKEEFFYRILQFLSFIRNLKNVKQFIGRQGYYTVDFKVAEFLTFIGEKKTNHYQKTKVLKFLEDIQDLNTITKSFSETGFRRSIVFPYLEVEKKAKHWVVSLSILEELYDYFYPFSFPKSFLSFNEKHELFIKYHLIKSFSTVNFEKVLSVESLINHFSLTNSKKKKFKELIIELISQLEKHDYIESRIRLVANVDEIIEISKLTSYKLGRAKSIILFENTTRNF